LAHRWTAASNIPDYAQTEDNGSISSATYTGGEWDTTFQSNGTIGDGPYGSTTGDFDAFEVTIYEHLIVDVDARILGSSLNAAIEVYDSSGTLVASNDSDPTGGADPYLEYTNSLEGQTYTVIIRGANSQITDPNDSGSGTGVGSTGDYRVFISSPYQHPGLVHGGVGDDSLTGDAMDQVFVGNGGSDTVDGQGGNDFFVWKPGDGNDQFSGGDGLDTQEMNLSNLAEIISISEFFGGPDYILFIQGMAGGDVTLLQDTEELDIRSRGGNDKFIIPDTSVLSVTSSIKFWAGDGNDTLNGGAAFTRLTAIGDSGNDKLTGGHLYDNLAGGQGLDILAGGGGNDSINGGKGNDSITGGKGADLLDGASGDDTFIYTALNQSGLKGATRDTINIFVHNHDVIDVHKIDADTTTAENQDFTFGGNFTLAGHIRATPTGPGGVYTLVEFNVDNDPAAEMSILLKYFVASTLTADDFTL
jgi:Ca2+-binding RTX toxin-like protein